MSVTVRYGLCNGECSEILITIGFNPFPNQPLSLRFCSIRLLKTLWAKEKLLIMSNSYFSYSVFYSFEYNSDIFIKFKTVVC